MYQFNDAVYVWIENHWSKVDTDLPFDYYKNESGTSMVSLLFIGGDVSNTAKNTSIHEHMDIRIKLNLTTNHNKQNDAVDEQEMYVFDLFPHTDHAEQMIRFARRKMVEVQVEFEQKHNGMTKTEQ